MFGFDLFDEGFELLMDGFFDSSVWELKDDVKVVNILADVDQKLVDVVLMVFEFQLLLLNQL